MCRATRLRAKKAAKPCVCNNHVHALVEEVPLFMAKLKKCVLPYIEEDYEKNNKAVKQTGPRANQTVNNFETKNEVEFANEMLLLSACIKDQARAESYRGDKEDKEFGQVEMPNLVIFACAVSLFETFTVPYDEDLWTVLNSTYAFRRALRVRLHLQLPNLSIQNILSCWIIVSVT